MRILSALLLVISGVSSKDVRCSWKRQTFNVVLNYGDKYTYATNGWKYKNNLDCTAKYTLGEDCAGGSVTCTKFRTKGNRVCNWGDFLTITDQSGSKPRFCKTRGPKNHKPNGDFEMNFVSNKWSNDRGLHCIISCPNQLTTTTTTTTTTPTTTAATPTTTASTPTTTASTPTTTASTPTTTASTPIAIPPLPNSNSLLPQSPSESESTVASENAVTSSPTPRSRWNAVPWNATDCVCGKTQRISRIIGGSETEVNEYPWQVGLINYYGRQLCGGALISDQWVLTAQHCGAKQRWWKVVLGDHDIIDNSEADSFLLSLEAVIKAPGYSGYSLNNDFTLLKLSEPVDFNLHPHVRPICLPEDDSETYAGFDAIVTGWGATAYRNDYMNDVLLEAHIKVFSDAQCTSKGYSTYDITENMMCAGLDDGSKDACQGDSGGPLITVGPNNPNDNYDLIGVVSWGHGCGDARYPGVYARVTSKLEWIEEVTSGSFRTCPRA